MRGEARGESLRLGRLLCSVLAAALAACLLSGCVDTDFFKEIVILDTAEVVDENNPDVVVVNSPVAKDESDELPALVLTDKAVQSTTEENRVVWTSKKGNIDLKAQHSVFDYNPRVPGIEASDAVRLVFEKQAEDTVDKQVDNADSEKAESKSESTKDDAEAKSEETEQKSDGTEKGSSTSSGNASKENGEAEKGSADANDSGDTSQGEGNSEDGTGGSGGEGSGDDGSGEAEVVGKGYGGDVHKVFDPDGAFEELQKADHIAAMGQAAVIVQAIGGKGALCAMDESTYEGKGSCTASSFAKVFSDELTGGKKDFEANALCWKSDGASSSDVKDINKLIKRVGANGVILFIGKKGNASDYFDAEQMGKIEKASIQLVPIDLSTVDGIQQAVDAVGQILSESDELAEGWSSERMASDYNDLLDDLVQACAATRDGSGLAQSTSADVSQGLTTDYARLKVNGFRFYGVASLIATDFEKGVSYVPSSGAGSSASAVKSEEGVLFTYCGKRFSPTSFWMQAAGLVDRAGQVSSSTATAISTDVVWFYTVDHGLSNFKGYSSSGPFARMDSWMSDRNMLFNGWCLTQTGFSGASGSKMEFPSENYPYLIVSATREYSAAKVKSSVASQWNKAGAPYYATPERNPSGLPGSSLGWRTGLDSGGANCVADGTVDMKDAVRENPCGLVDSWTAGGFESMLECAWLTQVYSQTYDGSSYEPISDMSKFSCKVGDAKCTSLESLVTAFYDKFYRYDASSVYDEVVTDE